MNLRDTLKINSKNQLEIGGIVCSELAKQYGTPLYLLDEEYIRKMCRAYRDELEKFGSSMVCFASKAFSCKGIYRIIKSEGLGVDVVTGGELYTALSVDFPVEKIFFHGNNKSYDELEFAVSKRVGYIVIDNLHEMEVVDGLARKYNLVQKALLRLNPGVDAHTHHYIQTSKVDSKFGFAIQNGDAENAVKTCLRYKNIDLQGIHCHIGSNIFEKKTYSITVSKMTDFLAVAKEEYGFNAKILNLGGGFGVYYSGDDIKFTPSDYSNFVKVIVEQLNCDLESKKLSKPMLVIEPGRSIVAEAGITLYTVGSVKEINGVKKYINIDGGLFENPRYALYQAKYTACKADEVLSDSAEIVTIAGKCCESSDMIIDDISLPKLAIGDIVAIFSTGAYNYSMASNYNRNLVPPIVVVRDGKSGYMVKPQSYEDLIRNDV